MFSADPILERHEMGNPRTDGDRVMNYGLETGSGKQATRPSIEYAIITIRFKINPSNLSLSQGISRTLYRVRALNEMLDSKLKCPY